ncbi:hypothetical protein TRAPUB_8753 [Trametes pubescens]|uniref:Uncharacterized protein n=1 Tax=Trametes pubescens TaxID=154538 RepID=A0A1M2W4L3_TRAPU|nr:hypothetical protein TRAPUB_8753 [Trametes pubescens]
MEEALAWHKVFVAKRPFRVRKGAKIREEWLRRMAKEYIPDVSGDIASCIPQPSEGVIVGGAADIHDPDGVRGQAHEVSRNGRTLHDLRNTELYSPSGTGIGRKAKRSSGSVQSNGAGDFSVHQSTSSAISLRERQDRLKGINPRGAARGRRGSTRAASSRRHMRRSTSSGNEKIVGWFIGRYE